MDETYENGRTIDLDRGAVVWTDSTTGALDSMTFVQDGVKSGDIIGIQADAAFTGSAIDIDMNLGLTANALTIDAGAGARTGSDVVVSDDSTGDHSVIDINKSGAGASVGLDYQESYNGSSASFVVKATLDNLDGLDTTVLQAVRGTGVRTAPVIDINDASTGSADIFDIDLTGVYTGDVFDFASSAAATGNVFFLNLDNAVAMTALHMEGSGIRTQPFVELHSDCTGSANFIDVNISGAATGNVIDITTSAAATGNAVFIDLDSAVAMTGVHIEGSGVRTQPMLEVITDSTSSASLIDISVDGAITGTAALDIDMNAGLAANAIYVDAGAGTRTADLVDLKHDGDGNVSAINIDHTNTGSGNIIELDIDAVHTGNAIDINYGTGAATGDALAITTGTNLAGNAISITTAGARTAPVFLITGAATDAGTDDHIFDINQTGALDSNVIDITFSSGVSTGQALDINMGTNVAGMAVSIGSAATGVSGEGSCIDIAHTGDLVAGADVMRISSTGNISSTSNLLEIVQATGAGTAGANCLYINATGANVEAIKVDAGTVTFDETLTVTGATTLSSDVTASGKVILDGTTTTSGAGAVAITGSIHEVTTTGTGDALTLADGTEGQRLVVVYDAEGAGADTAVITPSNLSGGTTITLNNVGDTCDLVFTSGNWFVLGLGGAAAVA
jgi:hypothetical protein